MDIKQAVARLNSQLPLKLRQDELSPKFKATHQCVLQSLVNIGQPPTQVAMEQLLGKDNVDYSIQRLANIDLVVLDADGKILVGAYPLTIEQTPHRMIVNGHIIYAMCALDAVSVAPMFNLEVQIESSCYVTQNAISINMRDNEIINVRPSSGIRVGVRWQMPTGTAAHSMCLEMVFLLNEQVALLWQNGNTESMSLFTLQEAIAFGSEFFAPLLE